MKNCIGNQVKAIDMLLSAFDASTKDLKVYSKQNDSIETETFSILSKAVEWLKDKNAKGRNVFIDIDKVIKRERLISLKAKFKKPNKLSTEEFLESIRTASIVYEIQTGRFVAIWFFDGENDEKLTPLAKELRSRCSYCESAIRIKNLRIPVPLSNLHKKENFNVIYHRVRMKCVSPISFIIANKLDIWLEPNFDEFDIKRARMPVDRLPLLLKEVVQNLSRVHCCSPDYVFAPLITMLGSLIGHKVHAKEAPNSELNVPATFWMISVGDSGAGKSPVHLKLRELYLILNDTAKKCYEDAMIEYNAEKEIRKLLKAEEIKNIKAQITKISGINSEKRNSQIRNLRDGLIKHTPIFAEPTLVRYSTNRATLSSLQKLLGDNENGILMDLEELKGLINNLSGARGAEYRSFLLESNSGFGQHDIDRFTTGTAYAKNMLLSIFSTTQPGVLRPQIGKTIKDTQDNDGLWQRFNYVYPEHYNKVPKEHEKLDQKLWEELQSLFVALSKADFGFESGTKLKHRTKLLDRKAHGIYREWCDHILELRADNSIHSVYANYLSKIKPLVLKIALLFEIVNNFDPQECLINNFDYISKENTERAIFIANYLEAHARVIFGIGSDVDKENSDTIYNRIDRLPEKFSIRDIAQLNWKGIGRDSKKVRKALSILEQRLVVKKLPKIGRIQQWEVNPLIRR